MRRCAHTAQHDPRFSSAGEEHAPAGLVKAALESLAADVEGGLEGGSDTDGSEEDSRRSSRSVSFDETARVMLVPTRHELLALGSHGGGSDADGDAGDARREEGLWWTRKDCNHFRRSFRRQIFAQGLQKSCTTLLLGDKLVYKIGHDEENGEEGEGQPQDCDAEAPAAGGACGGSSGGGTEVAPSPSPILAAVAQDFV